MQSITELEMPGMHDLFIIVVISVDEYGGVVLPSVLSDSLYISNNAKLVIIFCKFGDLLICVIKTPVSILGRRSPTLFQYCTRLIGQV